MYKELTCTRSLAVLLVCFSLERTSVRVDQYVCMGCQSGQAGHGTFYFPSESPSTRLLPAIMLAFTLVSCNQSNRGIRLVTIQSTGMLEALVPPVHGHQPVQTRRTRVCDMYQSGYIPPLPNHTVFVPDHTFFQEYHSLFSLYSMVYNLNQKSAIYVTQEGVRRLYSTGI